MAKSEKMRLDQLLVQRGLVPSRTLAKALIISGNVLVDETPIDKTGTLTSLGATIRIKEMPEFVSRGGLKIKKALDEFTIDVTGKICMDVGASTGGFTDCLLKRGAKKVYAVDVGYGQLHWRLQSDARVIRMDRQNFRYLDVHDIPDRIDILTMDVSFISIKLLLEKVVAVFAKDPDQTPHLLLALIKPQFEVGRDKISKGGIVKDAAAREQTVSDLEKLVASFGFTQIRTTTSPIKGASGNSEYLLAAQYLRL